MATILGWHEICLASQPLCTAPDPSPAIAVPGDPGLRSESVPSSTAGPISVSRRLGVSATTDIEDALSQTLVKQHHDKRMVRSVTGKSYEIDEILEILGQHEDQLIYPSFDETTGMSFNADCRLTEG